MGNIILILVFFFSLCKYKKRISVYHFCQIYEIDIHFTLHWETTDFPHERIWGFRIAIGKLSPLSRTTFVLTVLFASASIIYSSAKPPRHGARRKTPATDHIGESYNRQLPESQEKIGMSERHYDPAGLPDHFNCIKLKYLHILQHVPSHRKCRRHQVVVPAYPLCCAPRSAGPKDWLTPLTSRRLQRRPQKMWGRHAAACRKPTERDREDGLNRLSRLTEGSTAKQACSTLQKEVPRETGEPCSHPKGGRMTSSPVDGEIKKVQQLARR